MTRTYAPRRKKRRIRLWPFIVVFVLAGYSGYTLLRPLNEVYSTPQSKQYSIFTGQSKLDWPPKAQAAVALPGTGVLETRGAQTPVAIASTAKLVTALTVLDKKPLKAGEQGPLVTITEADVANYNAYVAQDGSVTAVAVGEQISEYQMIQAIMLPSANNIADTMAIWAFGSLAAYGDAANKYVKANGMPNTFIGDDASGLSATTTSTARDLAQLGMLAMKHPVLSEIVGQKTAVLPVAGQVNNVNFLLGSDNIIGVKTGNTDEAGGVFISASRVTVDDKPQTIVTSVAGSANLYGALKESQTLVRSAQKNFGVVKIIRKGDVVARYNQPWGDSLAARADSDLTVFSWRGATVSARGNLEPLSPKTTTNGKVGTIKTADKGIDVSLDKPSSKPSALWRLTHPF